MESLATESIPRLLERFLTELGAHARATHNHYLQELVPLTMGYQVDYSRMPPEDPSLFFPALVQALGLNEEMTLQAQTGLVARTYQNLAGYPTVVSEEADYASEPNTTIMALQPQPTLQGVLNDHFREMDSTTGGSAVPLLASSQDGDVLLTQQTCLASPLPDLLTITMPYNPYAPIVTAQQCLHNLSGSQRVTVPALTEGGGTGNIPYDVKSVICVMQQGDQAHYVTLLFTPGGVLLCDDGWVGPLAEYPPLAGRAITSLEDFCRLYGYVPTMFFMTRSSESSSSGAGASGSHP